MRSNVLNKTIYTLVGKNDKSWPQILTICISTLSSLTCGLMFVWPSPYILKISRDKINYNISEEEAAKLTIIPPITTMISCLFFSKLNDVIGRKVTLMLIAIPYIIFMLLTVVATDIKTFYIARAFTGLGDSIYYVSLSMYIAEIATPKIRGTWGNMIIVSLYFGTFLMNIIGSYLSIKNAAYICLPIPLSFLVLMLALPESPYFYVMKGQDGNAKISLKFLRGQEDIDDEFIQLKAAVERQIEETDSWVNLVKIPGNRRALIAGIFLRVSQQMTGTMVFNNLAQFIFEKADTKISAEMSSVFYSGMLFIATVCTTYTVEKFGRRKNYLYSLLSCAIILLSLAVYFFLDGYFEVNLKPIQWFPLAGMLLYIIAMSFGVGLVPSLMLGELFSANIKAKALTLLTVITSLSQFAANHIFYTLYIKFGLYAPFFLFSIGSFTSTILTQKLVPETKGKTLEEIQLSLRK